MQLCCSKIAQWDSHWNVENLGFLKLLYFDSKISHIIFLYIFRMFMTWASKRNKREVSIFISFEVIIIWISSNLTSKSHFFKIKHLYHMYFNFDLAYKTIAVYENALRLPLLFGLGMNLDCPLVTHYMLVYMLLNYLLGACLIFCFCSLMNSFHSRLVVFF